MDEIISYKMCAVKVRNAKLRNYLKGTFTRCDLLRTIRMKITHDSDTISLHLVYSDHLFDYIHQNTKYFTPKIAASKHTLN
jgi:hypothetical protein